MIHSLVSAYTFLCGSRAKNRARKKSEYISKWLSYISSHPRRIYECQGNAQWSRWDSDRNMIHVLLASTLTRWLELFRFVLFVFFAWFTLLTLRTRFAALICSLTNVGESVKFKVTFSDSYESQCIACAWSKCNSLNTICQVHVCVSAETCVNKAISANIAKV